MNVEFEPSSLQIEVNEVMTVKPHSLSLLIQTNSYCVCVMHVAFFRGHFFTLSFISSLEAIARAVDDHELFMGAFLLMIVTVH